MTRPPSITVDRNTTLTQLREFTDNLKDTKRLRGKQNEDGSITLYAKDAKRGVGSKLFGHSEKSLRKHEMAREAVNRVLTNTERSIGGVVLGNARLALSTGSVGEMKALSVKLLGSSAQMESLDKSRLSGPGLDKAGAGVENVLDWAQERIKNIADTGRQLTELSDEFAGALGGYFNSQPIAIRENLALSSGRQLKDDLIREFENRLGDDHPALKDREALDAFLDQVFDRLKVELLPNHELEDGSVQIGDEIYTKVGEPFGDGAHAIVQLYRCGDKEIVLKIAKDDEAMEEFSREIGAHREVSGETGDQNIVGLIGAVRTQNGKVAIALEYAKHGLLHGVKEKMFENTGADAIEPPRLNDEQRTVVGLTLVQDMLKGLGRMQSSGEGILHLDFSSRNIFVGDGGVAKIADFGRATKVSEFRLETLPLNAGQYAPELLREHDTILDLKTTPEYKETRAKAREEFRGAGFENWQKDELAKSVRLDQYLQDTPSTEDVGQRLGKKAEVWSLGVVAYELLMGSSPSRFEFSDDVRNDYFAFAADPNNRALDVRDENGNVIRQGYFGSTTGNRVVDDLINQLMHPDPSQRPTPEQVLNHDAFNLGFFDGDVGHALVEQMMQPR